MSKSLDDKFSELLELANVDISYIDEVALKQSKHEVDELIIEKAENDKKNAIQKRVLEQLKSAQIDPNWRIDTLSTQKNPDVPKLINLFMDVFRQQAKKDAKPFGLCVHGDYGTGKSHFAGAFTHKYVEMRKSVGFYNANYIVEIRRLAQDYSSRSSESWTDLRQHCIDVELLVLDEIGRDMKKLSDFYAQTLGELIRERHKLGRSCIFVSNTQFAQWETVFGKYLMESIKHYTLTNVPFYGQSLR